MSVVTGLNHDFSQRVVLHTADAEWLPSPMAGVERRMLDVMTQRNLHRSRR